MGEPITIKLTRFAIKQKPVGNQHVWVLGIKAFGIGIPSEIFVHKVDDPNIPLEGDHFENIASVNDLNEFPKIRNVFLKEGDFQIPFYRQDYVEMWLHSADEADQAYEIVKSHVKELLANFVATLALDAVSSFTNTITEDSNEEEEEILTMSKPSKIILSFEPNGTATEAAGDQGIDGPFNHDIKGWLPISEQPECPLDPVPANAKFYYNIFKHSELGGLFPLDTPVETHQLFYEGQLLPYDGPYVITRDTIYWTDFAPGAFSDFAIVGNAPWDVSYVDSGNPGDPKEMSILVFAKT